MSSRAKQTKRPSRSRSRAQPAPRIDPSLVPWLEGQDPLDKVGWDALRSYKVRTYASAPDLNAQRLSSTQTDLRALLADIKDIQEHDTDVQVPLWQLYKQHTGRDLAVILGTTRVCQVTDSGSYLNMLAEIEPPYDETFTTMGCYFSLGVSSA